MSTFAHFGADHILLYVLPVVGAVALIAWAEKRARRRAVEQESDEDADVR